MRLNQTLKRFPNWLETHQLLLLPAKILFLMFGNRPKMKSFVPIQDYFGILSVHEIICVHAMCERLRCHADEQSELRFCSSHFTE